MRIEQMRVIAAARTPGEWVIKETDSAYTVFPIAKAISCYNADGYPEALVSIGYNNAEFIAMAAHTYDKLLAVAEAASDDALLWNEELCNTDEDSQHENAVIKLKQALKELEAE